MNLAPPFETRAQPRGIRRALEEDHAALELLHRSLVAALESGAEPQVAEAWGALDARLRSHLALEEEFILPVFAAVDPGESEALVQEHRTLRAQSRALGVCLPSQHARDAQAMLLLTHLDEHARREGTRVYRFTERRLGSPQVRRTIATRLAEAMMRGGPDAQSPGDAIPAGRSLVTQETVVADIMAHNVTVLAEDDRLSRVAEALDLFPLPCIPVVNGARLVGMVTRYDIARGSMAGLERSVAGHARQSLALAPTCIRDVMRAAVLTTEPHELVSTAAARMLEAEVEALPVLSPQGEVMGLVALADILRLAARRGLLAGI